MTRWVIIGAAFAGVLLAAATARAASPRRGSRAGGPDRQRLLELLAAVEDFGALPGFTTFGDAVALGESSWNPDARNASAVEARQAASALDGALSRGFFSQNPSVGSDRAAWTFGSGGWFGFVPASGMAAGGPEGPFSREPPRSIFDPVKSVVMAVDYAARIIDRWMDDIPAEHQTQMALRRGWVRPALAADWQQTNARSRETRERFERRLVTTGLTATQARRFADSPVQLGSYTGPEALLRYLEGRP